MRELCRVEAKGLGFGFSQPDETAPDILPNGRSGSSEMAASNAALAQARAKLQRLKGR
jgi:hypothetical protein